MNMDGKSIKVNGLYKKKISLMEALLQCVTQERENLIHLDVENLWGLMEEKETIMRSLEEIQQEIDKGAEGQKKPVRHGAGETYGEEAVKAASLKEEILTRVKENVSFIQETLGFMDEVVSSLASGKSGDQTYRPLSMAPKEPSPMIYHREV